MSQYTKPPITEAIIELRFATPPTGRKEVLSAAKSLKRKYPRQEEQSVFQLAIEPLKTPTVKAPTFQSVKMSEPDSHSILVLGVMSFASSALPPYIGWPNFIDSFKSDWRAVSLTYRIDLLCRIGVRYLNRIDIPKQESGLIQIGDYLNLGVAIPDLGQAPLNHEYSNAIFPFPDQDVTCHLNFGTAISPLLEHSALMLDIEVACDTKLPTKIEDVWERLSDLRALKNKIFESCITDKTRALFNDNV